MSYSGSRRSSSISFPIWEGSPAAGRLTFRVRAARSQDLNDLSEVLASSFHRQDGWMGWFYPLLRFGIQEDLRSRLRVGEPNHLCLVAVENRSSTCSVHSELTWIDRSGFFQPGDMIVGTVEVGLRIPTLWQWCHPLASKRYLYISNLAVRTTHRRQGVGRHLLLACEQVAQNWGSSELYLHVLEDNQPARALYEGLGYRVEQAEWGLESRLWRHPQQLLLRKQLTLSS